jgi:hypothetical protein
LAYHIGRFVPSGEGHNKIGFAFSDHLPVSDWPGCLAAEAKALGFVLKCPTGRPRVYSASAALDDRSHWMVVLMEGIERLENGLAVLETPTATNKNAHL